MNSVKRTLAALTATIICMTGTPAVLPELADTVSMTANAAEELKYGDLTYQVIGDTITVTGCDASAEKLVIPEEIEGKAVTVIGLGAFAGCTSLTSVVIPESVTMIGMEAFAGTGLKSVTIPKSVTVLSTSVFSGCTSLESAVILAEVTYLGADLFSGCTSLKRVAMPESVTSIGISAFSGCTDLKSIWIPKSVTKVIMNAFSDTSLTDVYYEGTETQWKKVEIDTNNAPLTAAAIHFNSAPPAEPDLPLGNVNGDNTIDASDAAAVLIAASQIGAGDDPELTEAQRKAADVNNDGNIDASDAAVILMYAAAVGAGDLTANIEDLI